VQAEQVLARDGEEAERVVVAKIRLHQERELGEIREVLQVARVNAGLVERGTIMRDVFVGPQQGRAQAVALEGLQLVPAHPLGRIEVGLTHQVQGRFAQRHRVSSRLSFRGSP
jgi:hypothetical protein